MFEKFSKIQKGTMSDKKWTIQIHSVVWNKTETRYCDSRAQFFKQKISNKKNNYDRSHSWKKQTVTFLFFPSYNFTNNAKTVFYYNKMHSFFNDFSQCSNNNSF